MSDKATTRFSIVIPAYNEENFIGRALESLNNQKFNGGYEIIVVDNNSTDNTYQIAKRFGAKVIKESERGVCKARQAGTKLAQGEIVISTDADNTFSPDWLKNIDLKFKSDSNIIAVGGSCVYVNGPWWVNIYARMLFSLFNLIYKITGQTYYASGANIAFYKRYWRGYPAFIAQGGDELYLLKQLREQGRVCFQQDNPVYTSARRQNRGFIYNLFVTLIWYYFLEYNLSKIFKKSVLGSAPHFSDLGKKHKKNLIRLSQISLVLIIVLGMFKFDIINSVKSSFNSVINKVRSTQ